MIITPLNILLIPSSLSLHETCLAKSQSWLIPAFSLLCSHLCCWTSLGRTLDCTSQSHYKFMTSSGPSVPASHPATFLRQLFHTFFSLSKSLKSSRHPLSLSAVKVLLCFTEQAEQTEVPTTSNPICSVLPSVTRTELPVLLRPALPSVHALPRSASSFTQGHSLFQPFSSLCLGFSIPTSLPHTPTKTLLWVYEHAMFPIKLYPLTPTFPPANSSALFYSKTL